MIYIYDISRLRVKSAGESVQSTAGRRGVRISLSNAGYTTFGDGVRVLATHSIRPVSPSLLLPCVSVCHEVPNELYYVCPTSLCSAVNYSCALSAASHPNCALMLLCLLPCSYLVVTKLQAKSI